MTGVYKIVIKDGIVYKYLNKESEIGKLLNERFKHKNHLHYFNFQLVNGYNKDYIGKHIVIGKNFRGRGDYTSPYIHGELLADINILDLPINSKIQFLYSLHDLLISIYKYKEKFNSITGDWALHNLIWDSKSGHIVNIDLEGFYTYSKHGPRLPWVKKENTWSFIKNMINSLKFKIISYLLSDSSLLKNNNYITIVYLPTIAKIQWIFPYHIDEINKNVKDRVFKLHLGELQGYNTKKFNVYIVYRKQDKISFLIKQQDKSDKPKRAVYFFTFEACIEKTYEHPISVMLNNRDNPIRTVLNIHDENNMGDFYISKFTKCV